MAGSTEEQDESTSPYRGEERPSVKITQVRHEIWSGPGADELERMARIDPTLPDRVIKRFEQEQDHRMRIEHSLVETDAQLRTKTVHNQRFAIFFAFAICFLILLLAVVSAIGFGKEIFGGILGSAGLAGIVWAFVAGSREVRRDDSG